MLCLWKSCGQTRIAAKVKTQERLIAKDIEQNLPQESGPEAGARQHILNCAARLFRRLGYATVSLRLVATEAGVTTGSLYHHFGSKDELVRALLEQGYSHILTRVERAIEDVGPNARRQDALKAALTAHLECLLAPDSLPAANVRIHAHVPVALRSATQEGRRRYELFWITFVGAGAGVLRSDIEAKSLVMILFGAMNWSLEWLKPERDDLDAFVTDLIALVEVVPQRN